MKSHGLRCVSCGRRFPPEERFWTCPDCGPVRGTTDVELDIGEAVSGFRLPARVDGRPIATLKDFLPVGPTAQWPALRVGGTPLYDAARLAAHLGLEALYIKDESLNPSGSLKDRATAVALCVAKEQGKDTVATASTGNAASSLALLGASAGMRVVIFVPETAPRPKVAQMLLAGARVAQVRGTYDQAFDLCAEACKRFGWFSRNTAQNPYLAEGKKTCMIELLAQTREKPPDAVFVGVGDGCVFGSFYKAVRDLQRAFAWGEAPRLVGVQAEGCAPLASAFVEGAATVTPVPRPRTYADSIAVGFPRDQVKALRAARETSGAIVAVEDQSIRGAQRLLASLAGVFAEPAGAAGLAGLMRVLDDGLLKGVRRAAVVVSGSGLKDTEGAMSAVANAAIRIEPRATELDALSKAFE